MTIDQCAGALVDAIFDAYLVDASLVGVRDCEDRLTGHTEAVGGRP